MIIESFEEERWKDIEGYEGRFMVSDMGRVKRIFPNGDERLVTQCMDRNGYKKVFISRHEGGEIKQKTPLVHRLVGFAFVPGYEKGYEINHKDGNKANNRWDNLEWVTRSRNMIHANEMGLADNKGRGPRSFSFCQFDRKGNLIRKWRSIDDCCYFLSMQGYGEEHTIKGNLTACLIGRNKSCCGFLFSFSDSIDWKSKEKDLGQMPVLAVPAGNAPGDMSGSVRFGYIRETEGFLMPNGKKAYATLVSRCCRGLRNTCAGYRWEYGRK